MRSIIIKKILIGWYYENIINQNVIAFDFLTDLINNLLLNGSAKQLCKVLYSKLFFKKRDGTMGFGIVVPNVIFSLLYFILYKLVLLINV